MEAAAGGDLAKEGQLADAAVFVLDVTEAAKALLGDIAVEHAEGAIEPEQGMGVKIFFQGVDGRGGLGMGAKAGAELMRVKMMTDFMMEWGWVGRSTAAEGPGGITIYDGMNDSAWIDHQPPTSVLTKT